MQLNIPIATIGWWIPSVFILFLILVEYFFKIKSDDWCGGSIKVDLAIFGLDSVGVFRLVSYSLSLGLGYFLLINLPSFNKNNLLGLVKSDFLRVCLLFIYMDLLSYIYHRFSHKSDSVWELHKMHHSATVLRFITFSRRHPIESEVKILFTAIPTAIIGADIHTFFGLILFQKVYGIFVHSSWPIYFPGILKYILVSPSFHKYHHRVTSDQPGNYGAVLAVWDYFFGTYAKATLKEDYKVGLNEDLGGRNFFELTLFFQRRFLQKVFYRWSN